MIVALITLTPQLSHFTKSKTPLFALLNPITRPDSAIILVSLGSSITRNESLNVEFDGVLFLKAAKLAKNIRPYRWYFTLVDLDLPEPFLEDGSHKIRLSFPGEPFSEPLILFKAPVIEARIYQEPGKPKNRIFSGRAASKLQAPQETLSVEIAFHSEGSFIKTPLPVKRITDQTSGFTYFEFETTIQGLSPISPKDSRYSEPFFAFRVTDQAGNQYYQQESYAQFMAPGEKRFGVNRLADIEMRRLPPDIRQQIKLAFRFIPNTLLTTNLPNGELPIKLKVRAIAQNIRKLEWTTNWQTKKEEPLESIILNNDEQIGVSTGNSFLDKNSYVDDTAYQVIQKSTDGVVYASNKLLIPKSVLDSLNIVISKIEEQHNTVLEKLFGEKKYLEDWRDRTMDILERTAKEQEEWNEEFKENQRQFFVVMAKIDSLKRIGSYADKIFPFKFKNLDFGANN